MRRARNERGLGLRRLPAQTGRSPAVISKYELGYRVPSAVALAELAHALATPMDAFFEAVAE
ncbi:helix-turn-helix domain-containing protein [Streptomyces fuscichromogenes]|uniref:helix-turn-helix domain-containing protein n=1 Tax=Streptomyces fuscichromogenes TaxID=1324013 RepID=UPI001670A2FA